MAITATFDLETWQTDAVNAFTNGDLDETIYCDCPEGFKLPSFCLRLFRALYGLRRSPLLWLKEFSGTLTKLGLIQIREDICLFTNDWLIVFFYVDDIVGLCRTTDLPKLHQFKQALMEQYELKDLGELNWFLGIRIIRDRSQRKLSLCQDSYVDRIIKKFHLKYAKPAHIPIQTGAGAVRRNGNAARRLLIPTAGWILAVRRSDHQARPGSYDIETVGISSTPITTTP